MEVFARTVSMILAAVEPEVDFTVNKLLPEVPAKVRALLIVCVVLAVKFKVAPAVWSVKL